MARITKRNKVINEKVNKEEKYNITNAVAILKEVASKNFDESIELAFKLNLDPTKAEQQLRGAFVLPNGSGKTSKILVICDEAQESVAKAAGADYFGGEEYINKIKNENWFDFDVIVATPQMMPKLGRIGQILGPKGLMPNPKTGTVTPNIEKAVTEIKSGKITYRIDKFGNLHVIIGKMSFDDAKIIENYESFYNEILRIKPSTAKGLYVENVSIASTMGPGLKLEIK